MAKTMACLQAFLSSLLTPSSRAVSRPNSLPLPFRTPATQAMHSLKNVCNVHRTVSWEWYRVRGGAYLIYLAWGEGGCKVRVGRGVLIRAFFCCHQKLRATTINNSFVNLRHMFLATPLGCKLEVVQFSPAFGIHRFFCQAVQVPRGGKWTGWLRRNISSSSSFWEKVPNLGFHRLKI